MSIKLIAADMDGTLLSSRKQLPKGFFPLVRTLKKIGVRFAPASGRQYYNLYEQFGEIADELMYISENGGMVCDGREIVSFEAMPQQLVCAAVELARGLPNVHATASMGGRRSLRGRRSGVRGEHGDVLRAAQKGV